MSDERQALSSVRLMDLIQSGRQADVEEVSPVLDNFLDHVETAHQESALPLSALRSPGVSEVELWGEEHPVASTFTLADRWFSKTMVGIELTDREIRASSVRCRSGRFEVQHATEIALNAQAEVDEPLLIAQLRQLNKQFGLNYRQTVSIIGGNDVSIRLLRMPRVSRKEIHEALLWKNKKELHFFNDAPTVLHYVIVDDDSTTGSGELFVLVVAAREERIRQHLALLSKAGIEPSKLIIRPVAKWSLIKRLPSIQRPCALIDLGQESTEVTFFNGSSLHYAREIQVGGNHFTKALTQTVFADHHSYGLSLEEAREIREKWGLEPSGDQTIHGIPLVELAVLMRPVAEKLVQEIRLSLDYYKENFKTSDLKTIYLTGPVARMPHMLSFLRDNLDADLYPIKPSEHLPTGPNGVDIEVLTPCFNTVGAALSTGSEFNFLPRQHILNHRFRRMSSWTQTIGLALTACLATGLLFSILALQTLDRQLESTRAEVQTLESQQTAFESLKNDNTKIISQTDQLQNDLQSDSSAIRLMKMISCITPDPILIREISWGSAYNDVEMNRLRTLKIVQQNNGSVKPPLRHLTITGTVYKDLFYADLHVLDFISAFERTHAFATVDLQNKDRDPITERLAFTLVLQTKVMP